MRNDQVQRRSPLDGLRALFLPDEPKRGHFAGIGLALWLVSTSASLILENLVQALFGAGLLADLGYTAMIGFVIMVVMVRAMRRTYESPVPHRMAEHAPPSRGLVMAASQPPSDTDLPELVKAIDRGRAPALELLRQWATETSTRRPRWLELVIRSMLHHGSQLERLVVLVEGRTWDPAMRQALHDALVRVRPGLRVTIEPLDDAGDADAARVAAGKAFAELSELGLDPLEVTVDVTNGTKAMTIGMVTAAGLRDASVQYFRQSSDGHAAVEGVVGPVPTQIRLEGSNARWMRKAKVQS